jgi:hypothetical protein
VYATIVAYRSMPMAEQPVHMVDTSRVPRGEIAARALVDAVAAGDDRLERHYLEIKGPLDLTTKKDQAKLVKFILGAANRIPDKAAVAFEGYAVMVIGVIAGGAPGVPPVEALVIEKAVRPFLGADGPHWDLVRVPVTGGNDVLLLLVDPPRDAQGPFFCLKDGDGLRDGAVYVRADGETREAKTDEHRALLRRGTSGGPSVDFGVTIVGQVERIGLDYATACDDYINVERARLLDALAASKPKPVPAVEPSGPAKTRPTTMNPEALGLARAASAAADFAKLTATLPALAPLFQDEPERRTEAGYQSEIDAWEKNVRKAWPKAVNRLVATHLKPVSIQLVNRVETYFHDVQLKIHLEGDVRGESSRGYRELSSPADLGLPRPPRSWGPQPSSILRPGFSVPSINPSILRTSVASPPSRLEWHNSGSVDITLLVGDLRPTEMTECSDEGLALLVPTRSTTETVRGTWEITARDHNKVYKGELQVLVVQRDLTNALRFVLGLEEHESGPSGPASVKKAQDD